MVCLEVGQTPEDLLGVYFGFYSYCDGKSLESLER